MNVADESFFFRADAVHGGAFICIFSCVLHFFRVKNLVYISSKWFNAEIIQST